MPPTDDIKARVKAARERQGERLYYTYAVYHADGDDSPLIVVGPPKPIDWNRARAARARRKAEEVAEE